MNEGLAPASPPPLPPGRPITLLKRNLSSICVRPLSALLIVSLVRAQVSDTWPVSQVHAGLVRLLPRLAGAPHVLSVPVSRPGVPRHNDVVMVPFFFCCIPCQISEKESLRTPFNQKTSPTWRNARDLSRKMYQKI